MLLVVSIPGIVCFAPHYGSANVVLQEPHLRITRRLTRAEPDQLAERLTLGGHYLKLVGAVFDIVVSNSLASSSLIRYAS